MILNCISKEMPPFWLFVNLEKENLQSPPLSATYFRMNARPLK